MKLARSMQAICRRANIVRGSDRTVEFKTLQYWNADIPADVRHWTETVSARSDGIGYQLLDEGGARDFIRRSYGGRYVRAFDSCALPAMQADLLRLCLMHAVGGLWIDAGYECTLPLSSFLREAGETFMPAFRGLFYNGVLMFRQRNNIFIEKCLELAIDNIEHRRCCKVVVATGPGVLNAVRWTLDRRWRRSLAIHARFLDWDKWGWSEILTRAGDMICPTSDLLMAYEGINSFSPSQLGSWLISRFGNYKSESTYWHRWEKDIYK